MRMLLIVGVSGSLLASSLGHGDGLPAALPATAELSRAAYERIKGLAGTWQGESTKGWSEDVTFRTIAGGSAVVETSFDAHPGETMMTLFRWTASGCVSRTTASPEISRASRPRRSATGAGPWTSRSWTAANLSSRDQGHMDRAVFRFEDARPRRRALDLVSEG